MIAKVEEEHEKRYLRLLQNVSEDKVFVKTARSGGNALTAAMYTNQQKL